MFYMKWNLPWNFILKGFSVVVGCSVDGPSVIGSVVDVFIIGPPRTVINIIFISAQNIDNHKVKLTT